MADAFIAIGSNIDREKNIRSALSEISLLGSNLCVSSIYESPPYGFSGDNFYNLVAGLNTELTARELSAKLAHIEDNHGRDRSTSRFSSRTLDLDLLLYDDLVIHNESLDLPRSDIESYAFVLMPLAEIAADRIHPEIGKKIGDIWSAFQHRDQKLWRVELDLTMEGIT